MPIEIKNNEWFITKPLPTTMKRNLPIIKAILKSQDYDDIYCRIIGDHSYHTYIASVGSEQIPDQNRVNEAHQKMKDFTDKLQELNTEIETARFIVTELQKERSKEV